MTLKQLRAFLALAKTLNFVSASLELNVSQSALSLTIKSLEDELGGKLFSRSTRKVEITQEGKSLIPHAQKLLMSWQDMEYDLKEKFKLNNSLLNIAVMPHISQIFLPGVIDNFSYLHPEIRLSFYDLTNLSVWEKVRDGIFELGICFEPDQFAGLEFYPLYREEFVLIVQKDHLLTHKEKISWVEILKNPLITLPYPSILRRLIEQYSFSYNQQLNIKVECFDYLLMTNLVESGLGLSIIPKSFCKEIRYKNIKIIEIENDNFSPTIGIVHRKNLELSDIASKFLDFLFYKK